MAPSSARRMARCCGHGGGARASAAPPNPLRGLATMGLDVTFMSEPVGPGCRASDACGGQEKASVAQMRACPNARLPRKLADPTGVPSR